MRYWITDPDQYTEHYIHTDKYIAENSGDFVIEVMPVTDHDRVVAELKDEVETERMRLVGCGVAALMNTEESKPNRITRDNPYWSASYQDVCNMVDREIQHRETIAKQEKVIEVLKACILKEDHRCGIWHDGRKAIEQAETIERGEA